MPQDEGPDSPESRPDQLTFSIRSLLTWTAAVAVAFAIKPDWEGADAGVVAATGAFGMLTVHAGSIIARSGDAKTAVIFRTFGTFVIALAVFWAFRYAAHILKGPVLP